MYCKEECAQPGNTFALRDARDERMNRLSAAKEQNKPEDPVWNWI
jgi:hypothetical protein